MNLIELSRRLNPHDAEIVVHDEQYIEHGSNAAFFYSFCQYRGGLFSLSAYYPVSNVYLHNLSGKGKFNYGPVSRNRYECRGDRFEIVEHLEIAPGSDPRVVSNGKKAYAIIIGDLSRGDKALLYDFETHRVLQIEAPTRDFSYGKNWQPYLVEDELFAVHELTPLRILNIDTRSGRTVIVQERDVSFKLPAFHQRYPMLRGGGSALWMDEALLGIGHATSQRYRHHPFLWSASHDGNLEVLFNKFFYEIHKRGYNIIDPTSLFVDRGDLYLGLCCTERDWAFTQRIAHLLVRFRGPGSAAKGRAIAEWLEDQPMCEDREVPNLGRHLFFCIEMPTATGGMHEFGGRLSNGASGHLVHGPYIPIREEARYHAELTYLTKSAGSGNAGVFDVTISTIDKRSGARRYETLGSVKVVQTGGALQSARLTFSTVGRVGTLLEFRVYVEKDVALNAFHIRTRLIS